MRNRSLVVAAAAQLAVAAILPIPPMLSYWLVDRATRRAAAAVPDEGWFIDGYRGPSLFLYAVSSLAHVLVAVLVAALAVRLLRRRRPAPAAWAGPWLALCLVTCCSVANPASSVNFGDPDGFGLVAGSYPGWLLPALITCWLATGGLALINTAALRLARRLGNS
ncbi:MAG TPA: hypothetical protein VK453_01740 [Micromonosporaceae bacterium]|nr:hypothetical protein [Micromonosporaceae bacterium]